MQRTSPVVCWSLRCVIKNQWHAVHERLETSRRCAMAAQPGSGLIMTPEWRAHYRPSARHLVFSSSPPAASSRRTSVPPPTRSYFPSSASRPRSAPMAAVASSSSSLLPSGSRPRPRKDVFKPKFPLDPFHGHSAAALGEPWFLKIDALLNATSLQRQNVIFVLGGASSSATSPACCG